MYNREIEDQLNRAKSVHAEWLKLAEKSPYEAFVHAENAMYTAAKINVFGLILASTATAEQLIAAAENNALSRAEFGDQYKWNQTSSAMAAHEVKAWMNARKILKQCTQ
jgi:hypothetical protein